MVFPVPVRVFMRGLSAWVQDGNYVQDAFPSLNATQREFLMPGMTEEEQNKIFD